MSYRIVLVHPPGFMRDAIKMLIEQSGEFQVVAEAENGIQAAASSQRLGADVIVASENAAGLDQLRKVETPVMEKRPRVVMLSSVGNEAAMAAAAQCGAQGVVLGKSTYADLLEALRVVARGGVSAFEQANHGHRSVKPDPNTGRAAGIRQLTARELEVLRLITAGATSKEVAEKLRLSVETVRSYRKSLMRKLRVSNIAGLINVALEEGLAGWTHGGFGSYN